MENDANIEFVMAQVGHLSKKMTRHYLHLSQRAAQKTAQASQDYNPGLLDVLNAKSK